MTWLELPEDTGFGLDNLPLGVFTTFAQPGARHGVAIGDRVLDLAKATRRPVHQRYTLNTTVGACTGRLIGISKGPVCGALAARRSLAWIHTS